MLQKVIVALVCITLSGPVFAREAGPDVPPLAVLRVALDLSDEQVDDIKSLLGTRAETVKASTREIRALEAALRELLKGEAPDAAEVGGVVIETAEWRQEIRSAQDAFQEGFEALLTPEQVQRLEQLHRLAHAFRAIDALKELKVH